MYGLDRIGSSVGRPAITDVWAVPELRTAGLLGVGLALIAIRRWSAAPRDGARAARGR